MRAFPSAAPPASGSTWQLDRRGREHLEKVARWLGLTELERLWDRDFVAPPPWGTREARAGRIAEDVRRLVLERGEEAEPVRTVLRPIREAGRTQAESPPAVEAAAPA